MGAAAAQRGARWSRAAVAYKRLATLVRGARRGLHADLALAVQRLARGGVVDLGKEAGGLHEGHRVVVHFVRDGGQRDVDVQAVGTPLVEDDLAPTLLQVLQSLDVIQHGLETVVHSAMAGRLRLVAVGLHTAEVLRDAAAVGTLGTQRDGLPVARQLFVHELPEARHEVLLRPHIVLEDYRQRPAAVYGRALGAEVRRGATDAAEDAVEADLPSLALSALEVETLGDKAFLLRTAQRVADAHVDAVDALGLNVELLQARGHVHPSLLVHAQIQHEDLHVLAEPLVRGGPLVCRPRPGGSLRLRVAHLRLEQREELLRRVGRARLEGDRVELLPREAIGEPGVATVPFPGDPAPIAAAAGHVHAVGAAVEVVVAHGLRRWRQVPSSRLLLAEARVPIAEGFGAAQADYVAGGAVGCLALASWRSGAQRTKYDDAQDDHRWRKPRQPAVRSPSEVTLNPRPSPSGAHWQQRRGLSTGGGLS
mmetsp:Transcript_19860/g.56905  ORF Transcript_19860/g.56905 Transcript_19860/m.56905 type:complete len:480 (+) Transcript_19860:1073-2512(+)